MLKASQYQKLYYFMCDLGLATMDDWSNTHFRRSCLELIRKHFDIKIASFLMYENPISMEANIKTPRLDNITIGMSDEILHSYYQKYFYGDPLKNAPIRDEVIRLSDQVCPKEFVQTEYYNNFFKKHGMMYQIGSSIKAGEQVIGSLSFVRKESEKDFTDNDMELLKHICDIVMPGLVQALHYEKLQLENFALHGQADIFPVAQIVLDAKHNVIYHNDQAKIYCPELTGGELEQFTHYFINNIQPYLIGNGKLNEFIFESGAFQVKVIMETHQVNALNYKEQYYVIVYFSKKSQQEVSPVDKPKGGKLTGREKEIVSLLRRGLSNSEIANKLFISPHTVKSHLQRIYKKNHVHSKTELLYRLSQEK